MEGNVSYFFIIIFRNKKKSRSSSHVTNSLLLTGKKIKGQIQNAQCLSQFKNRVSQKSKKKSLDQKFNFNARN